MYWVWQKNSYEDKYIISIVIAIKDGINKHKASQAWKNKNQLPV